MDKKPEFNQIEISLDKPEYSPGEKMTGALHLRLKKPTLARGLNISFYGTHGVFGSESINEDYAVRATISGKRTYLLEGNVLAAADVLSWLEELGILRQASDIDVLLEKPLQRRSVPEKAVFHRGLPPDAPRLKKVPERAVGLGLDDLAEGLPGLRVVETVEVVQALVQIFFGQGTEFGFASRRG